jgi:hypothetical protein
MQRYDFFPNWQIFVQENALFAAVCWLKTAKIHFGRLQNGRKNLKYDAEVAFLP